MLGRSSNRRIAQQSPTPCTMTESAQEAAAAAAAPEGAEQQQQQDVAAQVQQVTASLQELLRKPEAE